MIRIRSCTSRYFLSLKRVDWNEYQIQPILIASILINIIELSSPLYINIVYTSILPSGSISSLIVLTTFVTFLILLGGWLKSVRLMLTGADGGRIEQKNEDISFLATKTNNFLRLESTFNANQHKSSADEVHFNRYGGD